MSITTHHEQQVQRLPWLAEVWKHAFRAKHVVLHGNVGDLFPDPFAGDGSHATAQALLGRLFVGYGYQAVARYDLIDGLAPVDPQQQAAFERALGVDGGAAETPEPATSGGFVPPPMENEIPQPDRDAASIRRMLEQDSVAAAVLVDYAHLLVADPERQADAERRALMQLHRGLEAAAIMPPHHDRRYLRNTIVMTSRRLGALPAWFYMDHPAVSIVEIPPPDAQMRRAFIERRLGEFEGGEGLCDAKREEVVGHLARLTDGFSFVDLQSLIRTSRAEGLSVGDAPKLVMLYKHGRREDPWKQIDVDRLRSAPEVLRHRVIGQDPVIANMIDMLKRAKVHLPLEPPNSVSGRPKGVFMFVGPTGVGKTELAKTLTEFLFGDESAFKRFDMSEFRQENADQRLVGAPPGFTGHDQGGELTNWVRSNPFTVLLFDEIDKAHPRVLDLFLQVIDDGRLTDGQGRTAYFDQAVIVFTSNQGSSDLKFPDGPPDEGRLPYARVCEVYRKAVSDHFRTKLKRPELLGRFGENVLTFDILRPYAVEGICDKFFSWLRHHAAAEHAVALAFDTPALARRISERITDDRKWDLGGRQVRSTVESLVQQPLINCLFDHHDNLPSRLGIDVDPEGEVRVTPG